jgi:hypothetical protein
LGSVSTWACSSGLSMRTRSHGAVLFRAVKTILAVRDLRHCSQTPEQMDDVATRNGEHRRRVRSLSTHGSLHEGSGLRLR